MIQPIGTTLVGSIDFQPDCGDRVALKAGSYVVTLRQTQGPGGSKDLPTTITIEPGRPSGWTST